MKARWALLASVAALAIAGTAQANEKLAQASGCMTCHGIDKKIIGPSYKDVAAKYRADKGAEAKLVAKVKAGGSGVWGATPMPPQAHVKDDDIKAIVHWVMTLK